MKRLITVVCFLTCLGAAVLVTPPTALAEKIAYIVEGNNPTKLVVIDQNKEKIIVLGDLLVQTDSLKWTPDGRQLIFSAEKEGLNGNEIYKIDPYQKNPKLSRLRYGMSPCYINRTGQPMLLSAGYDAGIYGKGLYSGDHGEYFSNLGNIATVDVFADSNLIIMALGWDKKNNARLAIADISKGKIIQVMKNCETSCLDVSPTGKILYNRPVGDGLEVQYYAPVIIDHGKTSKLGIKAQMLSAWLSDNEIVYTERYNNGDYCLERLAKYNLKTKQSSPIKTQSDNMIMGLDCY